MDTILFNPNEKNCYRYDFLYGSSIQFFDNYALVTRSNGAIHEYIEKGDILLLRCACENGVTHLGAGLYIETKSGTHKICFDMDTMYSDIMKCVFRLRSFCCSYDTGSLFEDTADISQMFWKDRGSILKNLHRLNRNYFFLDIKTTGSSLETDYVYAIRLTECIGTKVSRVFQSYIHLNDDILAGCKGSIPAGDYPLICQAPLEKDVVDEYYDFVCRAERLYGYSGHLFVLGNAKDKFSFMNKLLRRNHKRVSGSYIDSMSTGTINDPMIVKEVTSFCSFFDKLAV